MRPPLGARPMAFVVRVQRAADGVRGQVVAVTTGLARVFDDLRDMTAFIEAELGNAETPSRSGPGDRVSAETGEVSDSPR